VKKARSVMTVSAVFALALCGVCTGKTITVNVAGGADFTSIQAAISDANTLPNDEIVVAPGTYYEAISFLGKAVRLYSAGGSAGTIIDGTGNYHVVQCVNGEGPGTILEGFTITGGAANGPTPRDRFGGGMYNEYSSPTVTNCTFTGQSAVLGGAMRNNSSSPTVTSCTFTSNSALVGGGMYNYDSSGLTVTNCTFAANMVTIYGGGMSNYSSTPTVTNCIFSRNGAEEGGGGMYNYSSSPAVTNCTFSENTCFSGFGDSMCNKSDSYPTVKNCIFWNDVPPLSQVFSDGTEPLNISYSDVQMQSGFTGPGNIDADPLFFDSSSGDLRLQSSNSPCVDTGDSNVSGLPATDLAGNPRIADGDGNGTATVDMGAYELPPPGRIHNITQDIWYDGDSTIQTAIDEATTGNEIMVLPGIYIEAINFGGMAITLRSSDPNDPNIVAATVIDGTGHYHVVQCINDENANTVLAGFTITGGNANGTGTDQYGGGMYNYYSSPTVTNCTFVYNSAEVGGGGMSNYSSSPAVTNCIFSWNGAEGGGGMLNEFGSPTVTSCTFTGNSAAYGAGMYNYSGSLAVTNCTFTGNSTVAYGLGGGMLNRESSPMVTGCTFVHNSAAWGGGMHNFDSSPTVTSCTFTGDPAAFGGGMYNDSSSPTVTSCTFVYNSAEVGGGGMYSVDAGPIVTNCILWGDTPDELYNAGSSPNVSYSDVQGGFAGTGNIDADPCFVDAGTGGLRLKPNSPCLDAGDSTGLLQGGIWKDMDGKIRFFDISWVTDTGAGYFTFVDMGAYELQCGDVAGDSNCDRKVDFGDFAILAAHWLEGV